MFNSFFFIALSRPYESILQFLFHLFANCKLSFIPVVSLGLNFIFYTHLPASNSLAGCEQCTCNIICLLINFVAVVMESKTDRLFLQHQLGHWFQDLGSQGPIPAARNLKEPCEVSNVNALETNFGRQQNLLSTKICLYQITISRDFYLIEISTNGYLIGHKNFLPFKSLLFSQYGTRILKKMWKIFIHHTCGFSYFSSSPFCNFSRCLV